MADQSAALSERQIAPSAHALTVFRVLPNGEGRSYTAVTFPKDPREGCEHFIRMARFVGWLREAGEDDYGVLDVLNIDADIVQDFGIPTAEAFQRIKRKLNLAVERDDG
jgi:hypothetical protein